MAALLVLSLIASAAAQRYSVEAGDYTGELSGALSRAASAWNEVAEGARLQEDPAAPTLFTAADPELMGPDIFSITLVREDEEGFEVWVEPDAIEEFPQALIHELGLLLGLPAGGSGVMSASISADAPGSPTEADVTALAAAFTRAAGDIDGDGDVDINDLAALGRAYGERGVNLATDLSGNGVVDAEDVELLRENYTFTRPRPEADGDASPESQPGAIPEEAPSPEGDGEEPPPGSEEGVSQEQDVAGDPDPGEEPNEEGPPAEEDTADDEAGD